jgi:hypothetical protein
LEATLNGTLFVQRPGGATYRASPLNVAFLDRHKSWYALHWTTPFRPQDVVDYCQKELGLPTGICAIIQSPKDGIERAPLTDIRRRLAAIANSVEFFRLDAQDYTIVWEHSGEYQRLISAGEHPPFTAIFGFGTDKFDPQFGSMLIRHTATYEIRYAEHSIWRELEFLGKEFKHIPIDPSREL